MHEVRNIFVAGDSDHWRMRGSFEGTHHLMQPGSVSEMVARSCAVLASGTKKVLGELFIASHGGPGLVFIGADEVTDLNIWAVAGKLAPLVPFVRWGLTSVRLQGCEAGAGAAGLHMLTIWSLVLGDVPVSAGRSIQLFGSHHQNLGWEGTVWTVANGGLRINPAPYWDAKAREVDRLLKGGKKQRKLAEEFLQSHPFLSRRIDPYG